MTQDTSTTVIAKSGQWQSDDGINWRFWLGIVLEGRWWIVAGLVAGIAMGAIHGRLATPIYESDTLIQFEKNQAFKATVNMAGALDESTITATEIQILKSRRVLGMTVDELHLDVDVRPRQLPLIGGWLARGYKPGDISAQVWPGLSRFARGGEILEVASLDMSDAQRGSAIMLETLPAARYRLLLPDGRWTGPLKVGTGMTFELADGSEISLFIRRLVAREGMQFLIRQLNRDDVIDQVRSAITINEQGSGTQLIDVRYRDTDPDRARRVLAGLASNYLRQNVERKSAEADQTLAFLERQLPDLKKQLQAAEGAFNTFRSTNRTFNVTAEGAGILQRSVETQSALGVLQQQRQAMLLRVTDAHPGVQALDRQIAALKAQLSRTDNEVGKLPDLEQRMLQLMRDVDVNNTLYIGLLNNAQELKVAKAGTVGNARIVDMASQPRWSVLPQRSKLLLLYALWGLGFALGLLTARQLMMPGVKEPRVIEQALGLPVYATVPRYEELSASLRSRERDTGRNLVALHDRENAVSESLRSLRTALQFINVDASNSAILIAGSAPGVGKSFICANLAIVLAQAGKRVVLVDSDMRRGHLHDIFGFSERAGGLSEHLAGALVPDELVCETRVPGLGLIKTGAIPPNPSELLLHPRFERLVDELCATHDHVIFDAGPLLAVTDSAIIGRAVGCTLLVARYQQTPLREIELATQRLSQAGVNLKGFILNDVQRQGSYGYGYGYQYTYSYRSGIERA